MNIHWKIGKRFFSLPFILPHCFPFFLVSSPCFHVIFFCYSHMMPIDNPQDIKKSNIFPPDFVPILASYDPLALLTSTTARPFDLFQPNYVINPQSVHQSTFIAHRPPDGNQLAEFQRPPLSGHKPPTSSISQTTHVQVQHQFQHHHQYPSHHHNRPSHWNHHKPLADTWDIYSLNITDELRQLIEAERFHLKNVSINLKPKFPVTKSRWKHQDDDIFVARSNNPFGHSTKWKLRY